MKKNVNIESRKSAKIHSGIISGIVILSLNACSPQNDTSEPKHNRHSTVCPASDATNQYVEVATFPDLKATGARIEVISGLDPNPHGDFQKAYKGKNLKVYFELSRPYDPSKEILFLQSGGPGGNHEILHNFEMEAPELLASFNVVAMDHRGVGCSRPLYPGDLPSQSMLMRYAAHDIEAIRMALGGPDAKINFLGVSYGTMLGQTYGLLYPENLSKLILQSAFSKAEDFNIAQAKFESLAMGTIPGQYERYLELKQNHPEIAKKFLLWAVRPMYQYVGRVKTVPEKFKEVEREISQGNIENVDQLLKIDRWVMPWMTRSIACIEIFKTETLYQDEFQMFPYNFATCSEFEGQHEYFNYSDTLKNIRAKTMILGGEFDLVTPIEAMVEMSKHIPDNYFYNDMHLSHNMAEKNDCYKGMLLGFLKDKTHKQLQHHALSKACTLPPRI